VDFEHVRVGQVEKRAGRDRYPKQVAAAQDRGVADHRDQRDDAGPAGDAHRRGVARPDEPTADRAAHVQLVAHLRDIPEVARDLAVLEPRDEQLDQRLRRG